MESVAGSPGVVGILGGPVRRKGVLWGGRGVSGCSRRVSRDGLSVANSARRVWKSVQSAAVSRRWVLSVVRRRAAAS